MWQWRILVLHTHPVMINLLTIHSLRYWCLLWCLCLSRWCETQLHCLQLVQLRYYRFVPRVVVAGSRVICALCRALCNEVDKIIYLRWALKVIACSCSHEIIDCLPEIRELLFSFMNWLTVLFLCEPLCILANVIIPSVYVLISIFAV